MKWIYNRRSIAGLKINKKKAVIITYGLKEDVKLSAETLNYVVSSIFLGQLIGFENKNEKEIEKRIALSWRKSWTLKHTMKNCNVLM